METYKGRQRRFFSVSAVFVQEKPRKKKNCPKCPARICYAGYAGIADTGGWGEGKGRKGKTAVRTRKPDRKSAHARPTVRAQERNAR